VSNAAALKRKRQMSKLEAAKKMNSNAISYDRIKQEIEFKVANRPLLVEQVSKAFIHNLNQIKELQHFVTLLREAGHNPDEHLTDEQRDLLISAEYYDRLNLATAYFPEQNGGKTLIQMQEGGPDDSNAMEGNQDGGHMEGAPDQIQEDIDEEDELEGEEDQDQGEEEGQNEEDQYAQLAQQQLQNFDQLDPAQQAAIAQAIQQQHMYQVDEDGMDEDQDGDEVDIEYDGIEGMEQQIEEEEEEGDDGEHIEGDGDD